MYLTGTNIIATCGQRVFLDIVLPLHSYHLKPIFSLLILLYVVINIINILIIIKCVQWIHRVIFKCRTESYLTYLVFFFVKIFRKIAEIINSKKLLNRNRKKNH